MKHSFLAVRAIASEFTHRIYLPVLITFVIVSVIAILASVWLVSLSAWWWLLAIPVFALVCIGTALLILARLIIKMVAPVTTELQRRSISTFVDHLQEMAEITQTPKVILLYKVMKDAVSPRKTAYIESVISGATAVKTEYLAISESFAAQPRR
jgi:hypothetical protein